MDSLEFSWPIPQTLPRLTPGAVHVWCLALDLANAEIAELQATLSPDEVERAARYHFDRHRRRFIACRGQVRSILAGYLNAKAAEIQFLYSPGGKPALDGLSRDVAVQFNVSNSQDVGLCAVTLDRELGVDVEHVEEPRDFDGLAAQFFARQEVDLLRSLPRAERLQAFFNCWTRKEAILKAVGTGLAFALDRVVVTLAPNDAARLLAFDDDPAAPAAWWLESLSPAAGYVGAIASCGEPLQIHRWRSGLPQR
jgi:4'-phosphopantetheinyl transferase